MSEEEKKKNISKNIFKILGIEAKYIQNLHIDVKLLSSLLEEKESLEVEKNIVKFLKDFAKLPHDVIDNKLKLFTKKITKKIDDVKLVKKVEFLLSNKERNKLIEEAIDNDILYNELDKKIEILESEKDTLKKQKEQKDKILRLRYLDQDGNFVSFGKEDKNSIFWADVYDGNQGFIVYGHQWFQNVKINKHSIGIDTGCVYGNKLSAVVFTNYKIHQLFEQSCFKKI